MNNIYYTSTNNWTAYQPVSSVSPYFCVFFPQNKFLPVFSTVNANVYQNLEGGQLTPWLLSVAYSIMLRLPTVGRALAGAAKGSLAPPNIGMKHLFVYVLTDCVSLCVYQGQGCTIALASIHKSSVWWYIVKCTQSRIILRRPVPVLSCFKEIFSQLWSLCASTT